MNTNTETVFTYFSAQVMAARVGRGEGGGGEEGGVLGRLKFFFFVVVQEVYLRDSCLCVNFFIDSQKPPTCCHPYALPTWYQAQYVCCLLLLMLLTLMLVVVDVGVVPDVVKLFYPLPLAACLDGCRGAR